MADRPPYVGVLGPGNAGVALQAEAREVGRLLAEAGCVVLTGGLGGVMAAASAGAASVGGTVVGVLPGTDRNAANDSVGIAIATGLGEARNSVIANTADGCIAIGGAYGTLSEIAFTLRHGKPVVSLGSWEVDPKIVQARSPRAAVEFVLGALSDQQ